MTCTWFELLSLIPWPGLRRRCCARHAERCPRCLQASETPEALPGLISAGRLPAGLDLWPGVRQAIEALPRQVPSAGAVPRSGHGSWHWAYAAAAVVLLLFAGFWIIIGGRWPGSGPIQVAENPAARTRVCAARIGNRPARVFQVQSRNPDRTIFWIAKDNSRS
jgi:hypothetical protein